MPFPSIKPVKRKFPSAEQADGDEPEAKGSRLDVNGIKFDFQVSVVDVEKVSDGERSHFHGRGDVSQCVSDSPSHFDTRTVKKQSLTDVNELKFDFEDGRSKIVKHSDEPSRLDTRALEKRSLIDMNELKFDFEDDQSESVKCRDEIFKCSNCDKVFQSSADLSEHSKTHAVRKWDQSDRNSLKFYFNKIKKAEDEQRECNSCNKLFPSKIELSSHCKTHTVEKQHQTDKKMLKNYCDRKQNSTKNANDDEQLKLGTCNDIFERKIGLSNLSLTLTVEKQDQTERNQLKISSNRKQNSITNAYDEETLKCTICNDVFQSKMELSMHSMMHTIEKQKENEMKKLKISSDENQKGITNDYDEEQIKCHVFGDVFDNKIHLLKHCEGHNIREQVTIDKNSADVREERENVSLHSDGELYECKVCQGVFQNRIMLFNHGKSHVARIRDVTPPKLGRNVEKDDENIADEEISECKVCGEVFQSKTSLFRHSKGHIVGRVVPEDVTVPRDDEDDSRDRDYECRTCGEVCRSRQKLIDHCRSHVESGTSESGEDTSESDSEEEEGDQEPLDWESFGQTFRDMMKSFGNQETKEVAGEIRSEESLSESDSSEGEYMEVEGDEGTVILKPNNLVLEGHVTLSDQQDAAKVDSKLQTVEKPPEIVVGGVTVKRIRDGKLFDSDGDNGDLEGNVTFSDQQDAIEVDSEVQPVEKLPEIVVGEVSIIRDGKLFDSEGDNEDLEEHVMFSDQQDAVQVESELQTVEKLPEIVVGEDGTVKIFRDGKLLDSEVNNEDLVDEVTLSDHQDAVKVDSDPEIVIEEAGTITIIRGNKLFDSEGNEIKLPYPPTSNVKTESVPDGNATKLKDLDSCESDINLSDLRNVDMLEKESDPDVNAGGIPCDGKQFGCNVCGRSFHDKTKLANHARSHKGETKSCQPGENAPKIDSPKVDGGKSLSSENNLATLVLKVIDAGQTLYVEKKIQCNTCGEFFETWREMFRHQKSHNHQSELRPKKRKCRLPCGKTRASETVKTVRSPNAKKKFTCHVCGETLLGIRELLSHNETHKVQPKSEKVDSKACKVIESLEGDKQFACDQCGEAFVSKIKLFNHSKCHRDAETSKKSEKAMKFVCSVCGAAFGTKLKLFNHAKSHKVTGKTEKTCGKSRKGARKTKINAGKGKAEKQSSLAENKQETEAKQIKDPQITDAKKGKPEKQSSSAKNKPKKESKKRKNPSVVEADEGKVKKRSRPAKKKPETKVKNPRSPVAEGGKVRKPGRPSLKKPETEPRKKRKWIRREPGYKETFGCDLCGKQVREKMSLLKHIRLHKGERPFQCKVCLKHFALARDLRKHSMLHWEDKPFSCVLCGGRYVTNYQLQHHLMTHVADRPYSCEICGSKFKAETSMARHVKRHAEEKTVACKQCEKRFYTEYDLRRHMVSHSDLRPHKCELCGNRFKAELDMKRHLMSHRGEFPFKCKCGKGYTNRSSLNNHSKRHCRAVC